MFGLGFPELILILIIALIIFGPGKLPEVGKAIGKSVREFKKATNEIKQEFEIDEPSSPKREVSNTETTQKEDSASQVSTETKQPVTKQNPYSTVFDEKAGEKTQENS